MNFRPTFLALLLGAPCAGAQTVPMMTGPVTQAPAHSDALKAQLMARFALGAEHGLAIVAMHPGAEGTVVLRLHHTYRGLRIFGSESVVVSNTAGALLEENANDRRLPLVQGVARVDTTPALTRAAAIAASERAAGAGKPLVAPHAELLVYPLAATQRAPGSETKSEAELNALDEVDVVQGYRLAYYVQLRLVRGRTPLYRDSIVDALDGSILAQWDALQTVAGVGNSQYNGAVPINTTASAGGYAMIDASRGSGGQFGAMAITNANHGTSAGQLYTNASNTWGDGMQYVEGASTTGPNGQTAAVNAMWGLMNTYDMLRNTLGWQSLDGQNKATYIAAHVNTAYDNAYYDDSCTCMYIGDGKQFFSLGAIDVIGHEMSHGVTAATSRLLYFGESGGLNESNSDIGGEMVEAYARGGASGTTIPASGNDWVMGREISRDGKPLRYLAKSSLDGHSPDAWSSALKRLDVHYSSGPNNRMFYFLAQGSNASPAHEAYSKYLIKKPLAMSGIGSDKAYRIWFRALTTKFTLLTNYKDARAKVLQAAIDLYGAGSGEAKAVQRAYAAINVGSDIDE
ncbi:MAG: M4 family metallopeptidase [Pseudomonadota bacterium]